MLRKSAIDELGERTRFKKWMSLAPRDMSDHDRKTMIWRDGMGEYILSRLQEQAWKGLEDVPVSTYFRIRMDEDLTTAVIGERLAGTDTPAIDDGLDETTIGMREETVQAPLDQESPRETRSLHEDKPSIEEKVIANDRPRLVCSIPTASQESALEETLHTETVLSNSDLERNPRISAILYLSPWDAIGNWEFKLIRIEGQMTPGTIFNLRRLLPLQAEQYMSNLVGSDKAVALASSNESATALRNLLRVSFYLEGEGKAQIEGEMKEASAN